MAGQKVKQVARDWGSGEWTVTAGGCRASFRGDKSAPELDGGGEQGKDQATCQCLAS